MTKILIKRGQAEASLPILDPGEPAITFESGGKLWIGTPSGNLEITGGGGGGTPGGSDTQIQFNDGGDFGGDSGFVFNDSTKVITLTSSQQSDSFIDVVHDGATSISNERSLDFYAINSGASSVLYTSLSFGSPGVSPGSEFGSMVFSVRDSGSMVNVLKIDPFELVFNEDGADRNTRWEGDTATHLFVTDAGLDAVQIGTTTAGDIADFRSTAIVFNESGNDRDLRIEGDSDQNLFFVDAGNDRVGIGTNSPEDKLSLVLGSAGGIVISDVVTDLTTKDARILLRHYDNSEEGIAVFGGASFVGETQVRFGGGFGVQNSATRLLFYAGATTTTLGGSLVCAMTSSGISVNKGSDPVASAALEIGGTNGAFLLPRMNTTQRNALTAVNGMIIYNTTTGVVEAYESGSWVNL